MARRRPLGGSWSLACALAICPSLLAGCRWVDSVDRSLPQFDAGEVIKTSATDEELFKEGLQVVWRFQSLPELVFVRNLSGKTLPTIESFPVKSFGIQALEKNITDGQWKLAQVPQNWDDSTEQGPFEEGHFPEALRAIEHELGSEKALSPVSVAIIDSGVNPSTPQLQKALASSDNLTTEISPLLWQDHASAIASVYAGVWDGSQTQRAFAPNARLHSFKIAFAGDSSDSLNRTWGSLQLSIALDRAIAKGARLINLSFAYKSNMPDNVLRTERALMAKAAERGVIFLAAAGNDQRNLDENPALLPARYDLRNILVLGSHTSGLRSTESSNWGLSVDLTAQGARMDLQSRNGDPLIMGGTSFAVPQVGAALALYFGVCPGATSQQAIADLEDSATASYAAVGRRIPSRRGRLHTEKLIQKALELRHQAGGVCSQAPAFGPL